MADEAEAIEAGAKGFAAGLVSPIGDIMRKVLGAGAEEAGMLIRDYFHMHRQIRWLRYQKRVSEAVLEAGFAPQPVPPKLLHAMIDGATLEDDDELQDTWANMLANAANPETADSLAPAFPSMLRELSSRNVKFLDSLYEFAQEGGNPFSGEGPGRGEFSEFHFSKVFHGSGLARSSSGPHYSVAEARRPEVREDIRETLFNVDLLVRQGILVQRVEATMATGVRDTQRIKVFYSFSRLGISFVEACRKPRKRAK